jgi:RimJ/RimL family protein N-acetyltransferase
VAVTHQGQGYAREAALAVQNRLRDDGVGRFITPTDTVVDGEIRWSDG